MVKDFLPISREDMKKGAGSSATSCIYAEMPMLTILLWNGYYNKNIRKPRL